MVSDLKTYPSKYTRIALGLEPTGLEVLTLFSEYRGHSGMDHLTELSQLHAVDTIHLSMLGIRKLN